MPRPRCCSPPRPVPLFWLQPALLPDALQLRLAALEAAVTDPQVRCSLLLTSCPFSADPLLDPLLPSPARRPSGPTRPPKRRSSGAAPTCGRACPAPSRRSHRPPSISADLPSGVCSAPSGCSSRAAALSASSRRRWFDYALLPCVRTASLVPAGWLPGLRCLHFPPPGTAAAPRVGAPRAPRRPPPAPPRRGWRHRRARRRRRRGRGRRRRCRRPRAARVARRAALRGSGAVPGGGAAAVGGSARCAARLTRARRAALALTPSPRPTAIATASKVIPRPLPPPPPPPTHSQVRQQSEHVQAVQASLNPAPP